MQVAHSAQLGDDAAMVTALRSGTLDMSANSQGAMANVVPEYAALGLPFLFSDIQKAWQLLDGPIGEDLAKRTAAKGMVVLGYWDNGIRHITNSKRPIKAPADVKGLKIRTPPDTMTVDIMQALGADTQQIKFAELYVALQQGVVDGQENPLANVASAKLYEVQKYLSLTGHKYEANPFVMSKRSWERLSPADQKVFTEAAAEATQLQRKLSKEADDKLAAELKAQGRADRHRRPQGLRRGDASRSTPSGRRARRATSSSASRSKSSEPEAAMAFLQFIDRASARRAAACSTSRSRWCS